MSRLSFAGATFAILFVLCLPTVAQTPALTLREGVGRHEGLDSLYRKFNEAYRSLTVASVVEIYTPSAAYLAPDDDILIGREKIRASFSGFFDTVRKNGQMLEITFDIVQRKVEGAIGYDVGIYTLRTMHNGKEVGKGSGKFVVVAVKSNGEKWQFQVDGYSGLKPPVK